MAGYTEHLNQVKSNLMFLSRINVACNNQLDWQVTTSFYVGVHLVNAFLAREANFHFGSHEKVKDAIDPKSTVPVTRLNDVAYTAYWKLRNLSRRSRYLLNSDNPDQNIEAAHFILEKHFLKAIKSLDILMNYFYDKYGDAYPVTKLVFPFKMETPKCRHFTFDVLK